MSSIVSPDNTDFLTQVESADGGLDVVGQQDEENIIEIRGDAPVGIVGGELGDRIVTGKGDAIVFTGDGDDSIFGGAGNDVLRGGDGDDVIYGYVGADIIIGGEGNDTIRGGFGGVDEDGNPLGDTLKGGTGEDIFQFAASEFDEDSAVDKIVDFQADGFEDKIKIFGVGEEGSVNYNPETGLVEVNGQGVIDIGKNLDGIDAKKMEDNDTWELF